MPLYLDDQRAINEVIIACHNNNAGLDRDRAEDRRRRIGLVNLKPLMSCLSNFKIWILINDTESR